MPDEADDLIQRLQADVARVAAPFVQQLGLAIVSANAEETVLTMPVTPLVVHGGVLCGQSVLAAADTAMVIALSAALGGFKPMTTVQLQTSFMRPVPGDAGELRIVCRILRKGKSLSFGDIGVFTPDGKLCAHATTTYALL